MMSNNLTKLTERIQFHYQKENYMEQFMDVRKADIQNFESILYPASLSGIGIPEKDSEIDYLAEVMAKDIVKKEFSYFLSFLQKVPCANIEITLDELAETLDRTYDELWDNGHEATQLFAPSILKREIRKRKKSTGSKIDFSMNSIMPILANELGNNQIIFSNKHCFGKTYPETIEKQILVSNHIDAQNTVIDCQIIQNLHFRNPESMRKIIVNDIEKSEFMNSN